MHVIVNAGQAALHVHTETQQSKREDGTPFCVPSAAVNLVPGVTLVEDGHWAGIRENPVVAQRLANGDIRELCEVKSAHSALVDARESADTIVAQCYSLSLAKELLDGERSRRTPSRQRIDALEARIAELSPGGRA